MSSIKSMQYLKHKAITPRKIKNLVNKALKDGFKIKPSKKKTVEEKKDGQSYIDIDKDDYKID